MAKAAKKASPKKESRKKSGKTKVSETLHQLLVHQVTFNLPGPQCTEACHVSVLLLDG